MMVRQCLRLEVGRIKPGGIISEAAAAVMVSTPGLRLRATRASQMSGLGSDEESARQNLDTTGTTALATNSVASMTKILSIGPLNTGQYATPTRPPRMRTGRL
jgi:hypothetical protein